MTIDGIVTVARDERNWRAVAAAQRVRYTNPEHVGHACSGLMPCPLLDWARGMTRGQAFDWLVANGWDINL